MRKFYFKRTEEQVQENKLSENNASSTNEYSNQMDLNMDSNGFESPRKTCFECYYCNSNICDYSKDLSHQLDEQIFKFIHPSLFERLHLLNTQILSVISNSIEISQFKENTNSSQVTSANSFISNIKLLDFQKNLQGNRFECKKCSKCIAWSPTYSDENAGYYINKIILFNK